MTTLHTASVPRAVSEFGDIESLPSICFVAHNAYSAVSGVNTGHIGGIERQQALLARRLAARGHRVSMITWDEGQAPERTVDGIRVLRMCRRDAGVKFLRFVHPKWTSLCRALRRADADIYYYNCGDGVLGQVAMWCRGNDRRSVYSVASDPDCQRDLPSLTCLRETSLYRYGLRLVDRVIVQTVRQQRMLYENFGRDSVVLPAPSEGCNGQAFVQPPPPDRQDAAVLWVGRLSPEKRVEWLLNLAEICRGIPFHVVGGSNGKSRYARELARRAYLLPNVHLHGAVPYDRMNRLYRRATVLCCTSAFEGFPNTFLEAWAHGVPVVTTFDPDGLVAEDGLGQVACDVEGLAEALRTLFAEPDRWRRYSRAVREHFHRYHDADKAVPRFQTVFRETAGK